MSRYRMKAIHEAESLNNLIHLHKEATGKKLTQAELAKKMGLNRTYVGRCLSLLKAPDSVKSLSGQGVTQNTNVLAYLEQVSREVDEAELERIIDDFKTGELNEQGLSKLIGELKEPDKNKTDSQDQTEDQNENQDIDFGGMGDLLDGETNSDTNNDVSDQDQDQDQDTNPPKNDKNESTQSDYGVKSFDVFEDGEVGLNIEGVAKMVYMDSSQSKELFEILKNIYN